MFLVCVCPFVSDLADIAEFVLSTWKHVSATMDEIHFPTDDVFNAPVVSLLSKTIRLYLLTT
jgi:hypothetical protein